MKGSGLSVTVIQSELHWEDKEANLRMFERKIRSIAEPTHLVVLPEMFSTGFTMQPGDLAESMDGVTVAWMRALAMDKRMVITGSVIIQEDGRFYNRLIWMLPTGELGYYDKRHLFSYAGEQEHYSPGNKKLVASLNGWKINLQICYDLRFPVWARQPHDSDQHYDVYINVANWPSKRIHAWKTLLTSRAIENQCYVVGVNRVGTDGNGHHYSGDTMIVNALGESLYHKVEEEDVHTHIFQKDALQQIRAHFPFLKDADRYLIVDDSN